MAPARRASRALWRGAWRGLPTVRRSRRHRRRLPLLKPVRVVLEDAEHAQPRLVLGRVVVRARWIPALPAVAFTVGEAVRERRAQERVDHVLPNQDRAAADALVLRRNERRELLVDGYARRRK